MEIYVAKEGQRFGPFNQEQIEDLIESGQLTRDDLFWAQGMPEWQPLAAALPPPIPPRTPTAPQNQGDSNVDPITHKTHAEHSETDRISIRSTLARFRFAPAALALLGFFMPFVEVSCTLQRNIAFQLTGLQLATGTEITAPGPDGKSRTQKIDSVPAVMFAFMSVIGALAVSLIPGTTVGPAIISGIGTLSLLVFNSQFARELARQTEGTFGTTFLPGFWLAVCGLLGCLAISLAVRALPNPSPCRSP